MPSLARSLSGKSRSCWVVIANRSVAAQIVPWNYPILMMAWKVGPALAAGVSIVFKPAEQTPLSTLLFAELVKDAGLVTHHSPATVR